MEYQNNDFDADRPAQTGRTEMATKSCSNDGPEYFGSVHAPAATVIHFV